MGELARIVEKAVKREVKTQLGLLYSDLKETKKERKELKQKFFDLLKRIRELEKAVREKEEETDYGM